MPPAEPRGLRALFWAAWCAVGAALWWLPELPFQDLPNHVQLLRVDRALASGHLSAYFQRSDLLVFGYSLHSGFARLVSPWLSAETTVRLLLVVAALALPLAVARVARSFGAPATWAGLLALPLALSWPVRVGLLSYVLALPILIVLLIPLARVCATGGRRPFAALLLASAACYLAHPLALGLALAAAGAAWWIAGGRRARVAARLALAFAPALALVAHDLAVHAFAQIAGTERTWQPSPIYFRPLGEALAHTVTRSFGLTDPRAAAAYAPLLACFTWLFVAGRRVENPSPALRFAGAGALLWLGLSVALPGSIGITWLLGDRVAVVGVALGCVRLAEGLPEKTRPLRLALLASLALALAFSLGELATRARSVETMLGDAGAAHRLRGRYLTLRLSDCPAPRRSNAWGSYDPVRHLWASALSVDGVTPYLFAFSRYLPVRYDGERYARDLAAPHDWTVNERRPRADVAACDLFDARQIQLARGYRGYDGVIIFGDPERLTGQLAAFAPGDAERLNPGLALVRPEPREPAGDLRSEL